MQKLNSTVLLIGERPPANLSIQVDSLFRLNELSSITDAVVDVLILPLLVAASDEAKHYIHLLKHQNSSMQIIIIAPKQKNEQELLLVSSRYRIFHIIEHVLTGDFENVVLSALAKARQIKQDLQLESMINENNEQLKKLFHDLEFKVQKRQESLIEARNKSFQMSTKLQVLLHASELVHQADSIHSIEESMRTLLQDSLDILQVKIMPKPQDQIYETQNRDHNALALYRAVMSSGENGQEIGSVFFRKKYNEGFKAGEKDFLTKIAEVIALAIDRLSKLQQVFDRKTVWEATFNAITDPLMVVDQNYDVVQCNSAFAEKSKKSQQLIVGKKCYEVFFQRNEPCSHCKLGTKFRIEQGKTEKTIFNVHSQSLQFTAGEKSYFVNQYHDITENDKMERKILESARMAEIGTIGSSIAHELNNPLGGMLSFVQLIKLDLEKNNPLYSDVDELEKGVRRCKDIVQNLLGFTRNPGIDEKKLLDLRDVIHRAVKIVELQTRSMGIEIKMNLGALPLQVDGYANHLTQAIQNLLQNSITAIIEQIKLMNTFKGIIEIQTVMEANGMVIKILDNSPVAENTSSLGISVSRQILHDHGGSLEFLVENRPFHVAKIFLPRPVLQN